MAVSKGFKWSAGIIAGLLILIIAAYVILENYLENEIRSRLKERVLPEHQVALKEVDVDLLAGSLHLDSLVIGADTGIKARSGVAIYDGYVDHVNLKGIKILKLLFSDQLVIGEFNLGNADIQMEFVQAVADTGKKKTKLPVDEVVVKDIRIETINYHLLSKDKDQKPRLSVENFNLHAEDLELSMKDSLRYKLPAIKALNADNFSSFFQKDLYELAINRIHWHGDSALVFHKIKVSPQLAHYEFARKVGHQTDRMDIQIDSVYFGGIDYGRFADNIVHFQKIYFGHGYADLYRDKRIDRPEGYTPPLPQQALRKLKTKVLIDSLHIKNSELHYSERVPGSNRAGKVFFTDLNMLILNLNNDPGLFQVKNEINFYATGALMGQSLAEIHWWFPVSSPNNKMFFSGNLQDFELIHLNEIVMPNEKVKIDRGYLNKLKFEAQTEGTVSSGELIFLYDKLKLSIFEKDERLIEEQTIYSFLANTFLRTNNPPPGRNPLLAKMHFERDMEKSAINFLWKSILSGVKFTVTPGKNNLERIKDPGNYFSK